jgi:hypothetical protein
MSDGACKGILDELKAIMGLVEIVVERVTVVEYGMDNERGDGGGSLKEDAA